MRVHCGGRLPPAAAAAAERGLPWLGGLLRGGSGFGSRRWAPTGEDTESDRSKGREPGFYNHLAI